LGNQLAIYSSLPLQGPLAPISTQIVNGEKLALSRAGGRVGPFRVSYVSLDDANPLTRKWSRDATLADAKMAAQDTTTMAYLGDYNSAATALSLPLINAAGILQISPSSPYTGLTSSLDAGQDEPERFYPSGRHTFGRLQPGDQAQATAQARLMQSLGVHKLYVLDDQDPFQAPLATLVAAGAQRAGIKVAAHDSVSVVAGANYAGEIEKVVESGAQAVFVAGTAGPGAAALWTQLHRADPRLLLLGPSTMVDGTFGSSIGSAGDSTYLTTPVLATSMYPRAAQKVLSDYRRAFGAEGEPYALYGYEAMNLVIDAIRGAGSRGNDRQAVIDRVFASGHPDAVLGPYTFEADGEPTLSRYAVDRIVGGRPVFYRAISVR
jgi:branched-chain amino acid transport system substrate-binding protein